MDVQFLNLSLSYKEDNKATAIRIPRVLSLVGLYVAPAGPCETYNVEEIGEVIEENIELLAEAEHDHWMEHKLKNGWRFGVERNDSSKEHDCLIPFSLLTEENREKDRRTVRNYPNILKTAGYKIVRRPDTDK